MKKILIALLLLLSFPLVVNAQDANFNFDRAYSDYIFVRDDYGKKHEEYEFAKAAYLNSKTLPLQEEAQKKTASMLAARDNTLKAYLVALRMKVVETEGIPTEEKVTHLDSLDKEVTWYAESQTVYNETDSLEDLINKSAGSESRWDTSTEIVVYKVLYAIARGNVIYYHNTQNDLLFNIKDKVSIIEQNGDKNVDTVKRWFTDAETSLRSANESLPVAEEEILDLKVGRSSNGSTYLSSVKILKAAKNQLNQANDFMKQIIQELRTAD